MRPLDLASAYATFAAEGTHHDAHFITHITDVKGTTLYRAVPEGKPAFDQDPGRSKEIANQITGALRQDPVCGNSDTACRYGEYEPMPDQVSHALMVAYTPQISVAVFVGSDQPAALAGAGLPKELWLAFKEKLQQW
jgi:membrane peptidoglycan carboxypeptidase